MFIEVYALILLTIWGACVGSFLNVVIYRVPAGMSVVSPPSRCPTCEKKLAAYDNVPVLGWLWLRGKCRYCKAKISIQYPLVEAATALLFFGLTYAYYFTDLREVFVGPGLLDTWPVLAVHLVLLSCMIAATMIDAKLYIIPLSIVWIATAVALVVLPGSVLLGWVPADLLSLAEARATWQQLIPYASHTASWVAVGSTVGLIGAIVLLRMKVLPLSFAEEIELPEGADPDDPDLMVAHPHPRREVGKEVLFLMLPMLGAALGYGASVLVDASGQGHPVWHVIGGVLLGYLVGGGVVWVTRILGTLAFGKEAMGLGDVHLMAAVGAVIGWRDTTLAFFIAPFFGIAAVVIQMGVTALIKKRHSPIPYGPYLCGAAVVVMVWRQPIFDTIFP